MARSPCPFAPSDRNIGGHGRWLRSFEEVVPSTGIPDFSLIPIKTRNFTSTETAPSPFPVTIAAQESVSNTGGGPSALAQGLHCKASNALRSPPGEIAGRTFLTLVRVRGGLLPAMRVPVIRPGPNPRSRRVEKIVTTIPLNYLPALLTPKLSPTGVTWKWVTNFMLSPTDSSLSGTLNAVRQDVLQALVAGQSISAAAKTSGIHRS